MHVLIAPDSFKESLSATGVCRALKKGLERAWKDARITLLPMADGGEGTIEAVIGATSGRLVKTVARDPILREIPASYGITGDGTCAVIEMAAASGLELLQPEERDPRITSTFGTGQLILEALDQGVKKIILGIGGSATNDGGAGMAAALGVRFTDASGAELGPGGGELDRLDRIHLEEVDPRIWSTEIVVACDVSNPLTGPEGASLVYGPQKGGTRKVVRKLDSNLGHLAQVVREQLGKDISAIPGGGAAGGLGAGMMAFAGGTLAPGFELVSEAVGLENRIQKSDLVITGEGRLDGQTLHGKTPFGVVKLANHYRKPVIVVAGWVEMESDALYNEGASLILSIQEKPAGISSSLAHAEMMLERTGERIARIMKMQR